MSQSWDPASKADRCADFSLAALKPARAGCVINLVKPLKSDDEIRSELQELIAEAVPEPHQGRRAALLTLADHWADILRRRRDLRGSED